MMRDGARARQVVRDALAQRDGLLGGTNIQAPVHLRAHDVDEQTRTVDVWNVLYDIGNAAACVADDVAGSSQSS